jgi:hypothetical protein
MVKHLDSFIQEVFHFSKKSSRWPELEDIFTFVDMSANTGHHLGGSYAPKDLRRVRRVLLARTIRMLHQRYEQAKKKSLPDRKKLDSFVASLNPASSSFVSLNWDTSLERAMLDSVCRIDFSYGPEILRARFGKNREIIAERTRGGPRIHIAKIHGSANWLYCDNCRRVFWFPPEETLRVADQIVREDEWAEIGSHTHAKKALTCCYCSVELSTRIATFSFRKALDFPMFQRSWALAEKALRRSDRWVFIGYSLPAADFEFKYLLKRTELACDPRPEILVVTGGSDKAAIRRTLANYQGLFGKMIEEGSTFRTEGLSDKVIKLIT